MTSSSGRVSAQLPPLSAARSTITVPGCMAAIVSSSINTDADLPGTCAALGALALHAAPAAAQVEAHSQEVHAYGGELFGDDLTVARPDDLLILGVEPESLDLDLPGIVVGHDDRRGAFEVAQLVEKASAAPDHAAVEGRLLRNTGILAGSAWALLQLIERRVPDIVIEVQAVVRGANPVADAELSARLQGLDFHRDVLPGNERYLSVLPVARRGWIDINRYSGWTR